MKTNPFPSQAVFCHDVYLSNRKLTKVLQLEWAITRPEWEYIICFYEIVKGQVDWLKNKNQNFKTHGHQIAEVLLFLAHILCPVTLIEESMHFLSATLQLHLKGIYCLFQPLALPPSTVLHCILKHKELFHKLLLHWFSSLFFENQSKFYWLKTLSSLWFTVTIFDSVSLTVIIFLLPLP